jgi:hypothetical protein
MTTHLPTSKPILSLSRSLVSTPSITGRNASNKQENPQMISLSNGGTLSCNVELALGILTIRTFAVRCLYTILKSKRHIQPTIPSSYYIQKWIKLKFEDQGDLFSDFILNLEDCPFHRCSDLPAVNLIVL